MTRAKDKDAKRKAGRKSTFSARKEGILGKFAEIYHQAHSASKPEVALFLNKLANWCISRWGYRQHLNVDIGEEDNDPAEEYDLELSETPDDDLSEAEAETRANYFGELRTKLGAFYRRKYLHGTITAAEIQPSTGASVLSLVAKHVPKKPTKSNYLNQYMKMYYQTLMKAEADRRLAAAQAEYQALTAKEQESQAAPIAVVFRTNVAREFWSTESAEVKALVLKAIGTEYDEDMAEWRGLKELPTTPAQHYHQIQYAGVTLRPIADSIAKQMRCPVIIMMPVVMPHKEGRIQMISVHGTKPGSLATDKFPAKDPKGYAETEALVMKYGVTQFTAAEIAERTFAPGEGPSAETPDDIEEGNEVEETEFPATSSSLAVDETPPPLLPCPAASAPPRSCSPSPCRAHSPTSRPSHELLPVLPTPSRPPPSHQSLRSTPEHQLRIPASESHRSQSPTLQLSAPQPSHPLPPVPPILSTPPPSHEPLRLTPPPTNQCGTPASPLNPRQPATSPTPQVQPPPAPSPTLLDVGKKPPPESQPVIDLPPPPPSVVGEQPRTKPRPKPRPIINPAPPPPTASPHSPISHFRAPLPSLGDPTPHISPTAGTQAAADSEYAYTPWPTGVLTTPKRPSPPPPTASPHSPISHFRAPLPSLGDPTPHISPTAGTQAAADSEYAYTPWPTGVLTTPKRPSTSEAGRRSPTPKRPSIGEAGRRSSASALTPASPLPVPSSPAHTPHLGFVDLPAHIQAQHDYLLHNPVGGKLRLLGIQWVMCVREFISFEMRLGFVGGTDKLSNAPKEIMYWRKSHRPLKDQPPRLRSLDEFVTEWWAWWALLQPVERVLGLDGKYNVPKSEMDWSALAKPGSNGFLLIMLTLTWWGMLRADNGWARAVKDVTDVLRVLPKPTSTSAFTPSLKRKGAPLSSSDGRQTNTATPSKRAKAGIVSPRRLRKR